jgi:hypothetical protein
MWENLRNLKTSEIVLRKPLHGTECDWLVGQLESLRAVAAAEYREADSHLIVEYDADLMTGRELVDLVDACGLRPEPAAHVR